LQRVSASIHLAPLTAESTRTYIIYRLRKAGAARGIFTGPALEQIYSCSRGNPRLINSLCDHALVTGYAADKETIDSQIVQECVNELNATLLSPPPHPGVEEPITVDHAATPEAEPIETLPVSSPFTSDRPSRLRYFSVALMTVLLIFAAGYSLISRFFDLPADEAENEAAVTEIVQALESPPEGQDSALFSERLFGHEMGDESDRDDTAAGQLSVDANDVDPTTIRKKIEVPAADTIESPKELNR
jgi:hypothetical protein